MSKTKCSPPPCVLKCTMLLLNQTFLIILTLFIKKTHQPINHRLHLLMCLSSCPPMPGVATSKAFGLCPSGNLGSCREVCGVSVGQPMCQTMHRGRVKIRMLHSGSSSTSIIGVLVHAYRTTVQAIVVHSSSRVISPLGRKAMERNRKVVRGADEWACDGGGAWLSAPAASALYKWRMRARLGCYREQLEWQQAAARGHVG